MSDFVTPEMVEEAKRRDVRFRQIDLGMELEAALQQSRPLWLLMSKLKDDADDAMREFAHVNLGETSRVQGLQCRVFCFRYALETFERILTTAREAHTSIQGEDLFGRERDYGDDASA